MNTFIYFIPMLFLISISCHSYGQEAEDSIPKSALDVGLLSAINGQVSFGYERFLSSKFSLEGEIDLINNPLLTNITDFNRKGISISLGAKFLLNGEPESDNLPMSGFFIKPEISYMYNSTRRQIHQDIEPSTNKTHALMLMLNVGKRWILSDQLYLDGYLGLGSGTSINDPGDNRDFTDAAYFGSHGTANFPFLLNTGLRLGIYIK